MERASLFEVLLRLGDTTLIQGHRLSEWCGHGPALEEDIALANTALDLIGHTRMWLGLAGEIEGAGRSADDLAYLRDAGAFRNVLLVERPKGDFAQTILRQFLFDAWYIEMLGGLCRSSEQRIAEIAAKAVRECAYHVERSADLVIRLGDGSEESHRRMQAALDDQWPYAREFFLGDAHDAAAAQAGVAPAPETLAAPWMARIEPVLAQATLTRPEGDFTHKGGRQGRHSEHLGFLLAEMQFLQRAYPGAVW